MSQTTTLRRLIYLTLAVVLLFPTGFEVSKYYFSLKTRDVEMDSRIILSEIQLVFNKVKSYISKEHKWPKDLIEAGYYSDEYDVHFDLSKPWVLTSEVIASAGISSRFHGKKIRLKYDPNSATWQCDFAASDIANKYTHALCKTAKTGGGYLSARQWNVVVILGALLIALLLYIFKHPLIAQIKKHNYQIKNLTFDQLKRLHWFVNLSGCKKALLEANQLSQKRWSHLADPIQTSWVEALQENLPIRQAVNQKNGLYLLDLSDQFEFNVTQIRLFIPLNLANTTSIIRTIKQLEVDSLPILVLITSSAANKEISIQSHRFDDITIIPNMHQLTQLKLPLQSKKCLLSLFRKHLPLNRLSPYQGKGGVVKSSQFFGREDMLEKLLNNPQKNYFIVGGRQLGKTSLLKALERLLSNNKRQKCIYLSLSDERLLRRLKYIAKDQSLTNIRACIEKIRKDNRGQTIRLLIDEADRLIRSEAEQDYPQLRAIRECSDEGLCQFVFAGFWDLYSHVVLDYHSPLRNFANTITVGALNEKAAYQLILQPMKLLGLKFTAPQLIDHIIEKSGGRANLINLVCEQLVSQFNTNGIIRAEHIELALTSQSVQDALQGWSNLTRDGNDCVLDRIIVYLTFIHEKISLSHIQSFASEHSLKLSAEKVKQAIQRLQLAHILKKQQDNFQFAVTLFAEQYSVDDAHILLHQEISQQTS